MFPSSGNTTTSLKNNLVHFQCSLQNRPRSFYLIPGHKTRITGKENTAMLPRQPSVDATPTPHWGYVSSEDNKNCVFE